MKKWRPCLGCLTVAAIVFTLLALFFDLPLLARADFEEEYIIKHRSIITAFFFWVAAITAWMVLFVRASKINLILSIEEKDKPNSFLNIGCGAFPLLAFATCFAVEGLWGVVLILSALIGLVATTVVSYEASPKVKQAALSVLSGLAITFFGLVILATWWGLTGRH